jgi:uncharacterized surface protein with fasciclin (FAS1) repeats
MDSQNKKGAIAVITLVIGVLAGGGIGYAIGNNMHATKSDSMQMSTASTSDADGVMVGGAKMVRSKDIVDNAVEASNVTTLVSLVKLAGLVDTLKGDGPFTVFAPNNDAFGKLDKETVTSLQKPENVEMLKKVLTYHVISGTYTSADLKVMAQKGEMLTSVEGEMLTPVLENNTLMIQDAKGNKVMIQTPDVISSNGVTHVVDSVLMTSN